MKINTIVALFALSFAFTGCGANKEIVDEQTTTVASTTEATETTSYSAAFAEATEAESTTEEAKSNKKSLNVSPLCQYPELPTGCEITSLTILLNYYGITADKCDLADNYLDKGAVGTVDFRVAFEGDPRDGNSYGCYAPVIEKTANRYISVSGSALTAKDITGTEFESLFDYIDNGMPVVVWATLDLQQGHKSVTWNVNGQSLTWYTPEHCMVLTGYDYDTSTVQVADPVHGDIRSYDMATFKNRYEALYKQAVIIG
jgi:uncharacterized protein YvpB